MISNLLRNIFGSRNSRILKEYDSIVLKINDLEDKYKKLSSDEFKNITSQFKSEYKKNQDINSLLPDAFAVVREASMRTLGLRHFDEQLLGGLALHNGKIAEMKTGEGKTLVSTLPAYLNSIIGSNVFIVTVNDYLARRDAEWMGQVHKFLGLNVGLIQQDMSPSQRKKNYACDITYATNSELGFDYLRDN
ncbi:MAG: preprotein translocase subunit SecA, partial [Gammaproteobacteria bacterium]|nr:preprotein translocase subunit SecA [Gammaproteobacteria bacterium]